MIRLVSPITILALPLHRPAKMIETPRCALFVASGEGFTSLYSVADGEGYPVSPLAWEAMGGSMAADLQPGGRSIALTVVCPNASVERPFSVAMSAGPEHLYGSLRIVGQWKEDVTA